MRSKRDSPIKPLREPIDTVQGLSESHGEVFATNMYQLSFPSLLDFLS
ncbi:hypothetical protein J2T12_003962 [Paenibacillus anaericanus]|nr:hypothetical protein [Paenibacillus anaericanus]MDQ0090539.1 hypothetical protein [Paenibacillus anaericanus]